MRSLLFFVAISCFAQSPTTIVGPIYTQTGGLYTGSFNVQSQAKTNTGYAITGQPSQIVYVTAGVINGLALIPNDSSVPNLTSYLITFANQDQWICIVPTSATPVGFAQICSPNPIPPNSPAPIPLSQLIPAIQNGWVATTQGGIATWYPAGGINGIAWYGPVSFTNATTVSVPNIRFNLGRNVVIICTGVAECGSVQVDPIGNVTVKFLTPQTGTVRIATGSAYIGTFTTAASLAIPFLSLQSTISLTACYDTNGNQFGAGGFTTTPFDSGIGGAQGVDYSISLGTPNQSGRCVFLQGAQP